MQQSLNRLMNLLRLSHPIHLSCPREADSAEQNDVRSSIGCNSIAESLDSGVKLEVSHDPTN